MELILNHSDVRGGSSVVSRRLLEAMRGAGHDTRMLTVHSASGHPAVTTAAPAWRARIPFVKEHLRILAACRGDRTNLFKLSAATDGLPLSRHPLVRRADTLMINWVNQGMLSLDEIARMGADGKRIVWTMHDMWNAVGICHHAGDCTRWQRPEGCSGCPLLGRGAGARDLAADTWRRKRRLYTSVPITFVAVSNWLADICRRSPLMEGCRIEVIPNAFPIESFHLEPRLSRVELGLTEGRPLIVMGAARLDDPVKGLPYAVEALNALTDTDAHAVFFGALRDPHALDGLRLPHTLLGTVADPGRLADIYAHATAVLSSSLWETLPGTLVEAQAVGAYPVAFDRGGQRDIVDHPATGWLAPWPDTASLAAGLRHALTATPDRAALRAAASRFAAPAVADRYIALCK